MQRSWGSPRTARRWHSRAGSPPSTRTRPDDRVDGCTDRDVDHPLPGARRGRSGRCTCRLDLGRRRDDRHGLGRSGRRRLARPRRPGARLVRRRDAGRGDRRLGRPDDERSSRLRIFGQLGRRTRGRHGSATSRCADHHPAGRRHDVLGEPREGPGRFGENRLVETSRAGSPLVPPHARGHPGACGCGSFANRTGQTAQSHRIPSGRDPLPFVGSRRSHGDEADRAGVHRCGVCRRRRRLRGVGRPKHDGASNRNPRRVVDRSRPHGHRHQQGRNPRDCERRRHRADRISPRLGRLGREDARGPVRRSRHSRIPVERRASAGRHATARCPPASRTKGSVSRTSVDGVVSHD